MGRTRLAWIPRLAVSAVLLALASGGALAWLTLPGADASLDVAGLSAPVQVSFDADGVPRIRAQTPDDAAMALGAVHARDRMFQMEMMRRIASGRLSELVGPATLRLDHLMRTLGLRRRAEADLAALPLPVRQRLDAYAAGVNAMRLARGRFIAPEFVWLGTPAPWSAVDSLLWGKTMALYLSGNWQTELARANLAGKLPAGWLEQMWPAQPDTPPPQAALPLPIQTADAAGRLARSLPRFPDPFTLPPTASNEWAVDGTQTKTGAPLLAGDPHLAFSLPGIWYLARLDTPGGVLAGATAPGLPFLVIGHNGHVAWTFTTNGADTEDVFIETVLPDGTYQAPDGPLPFVQRQERIGIRGQADQLLTVRETRHGPVISDLDRPEVTPGAGQVMAVAMAALQPADSSATGLMALNEARTVSAAGQAGAAISTPVQNLLTADAMGIGQYTTGRIPLRRAGDGSTPVAGADGAHDWTGFASGDALPHIVAPPSGRLVNANERVAPASFPVFMGRDWFGDWRARRIRSLLAASQQHTAAGFAAMQMDVTSLFAQALLPRLAAVPTTTTLAARALGLLTHWDGTMDRDLPQPAIFNGWMRRFEAGVLARASVPALGPWADFVAFVLSPDGQHWCGTDCTPLLSATLAETVDELARRLGPVPADWRWGDVHQAVFGHPILGRIGAVSIAQSGDDVTVQRGGTRRGSFESIHGAAFRAVFDLSNLDASLFIATPGQSGNPASMLARSMALRWRDGGMITLGPMQAGDAATLALRPQQAN